MKSREFASFLAVLIFVPPLLGCIPHIAPPGVKMGALPTNLEDPDKYRVDSTNFPIFRIKEQFRPPRWKVGAGESRYPMASIDPPDIWKVTHRVEDVFLIYSDAYNDRQCRLLANIEPSGMAGGFISRWFGSKCHARYLYHIPITLDGTVRGGWKLLYNPKRVTFARDRYVNMEIDQTQVAAWGPQPIFVPIE